MHRKSQKNRTTHRRWLACAMLMSLVPLTVAATSMEQANVQAAIEDLASRQSIAADDIWVHSREEVTWPDGSLGCPRPDMAYKQQQVNGSRLILLIGERCYAYHAGPSGSYRFCEQPAPIRSTPPDDDAI